MPTHLEYRVRVRQGLGTIAFSTLISLSTALLALDVPDRFSGAYEAYHSGNREQAEAMLVDLFLEGDADALSFLQDMIMDASGFNDELTPESKSNMFIEELPEVNRDDYNTRAPKNYIEEAERLYNQSGWRAAVNHLAPRVEEGRADARDYAGRLLVEYGNPIEKAYGLDYVRHAAGAGNFEALKYVEERLPTYIQEAQTAMVEDGIQGAEDVLRPLADQGRPDAMHMLGSYLLAHGDYEADRERGLRYIQSAADAGFISSIDYLDRRLTSQKLRAGLSNSTDMTELSIANEYGATADGGTLISEIANEADAERAADQARYLENQRAMATAFNDVSHPQFELMFFVDSEVAGVRAIQEAELVLLDLFGASYQHGRYQTPNRSGQSLYVRAEALEQLFAGYCEETDDSPFGDSEEKEEDCEPRPEHHKDISPAGLKQAIQMRYHNDYVFNLRRDHGDHVGDVDYSPLRTADFSIEAYVDTTDASSRSLRGDAQLGEAVRHDLNLNVNPNGFFQRDEGLSSDTVLFISRGNQRFYLETLDVRKTLLDFMHRIHFDFDPFYMG